MFAYCNNNPIIYADPTGHRPIWEKRYGNVVMYTDTGAGGASSTARKDLATANSLLGKTADELTQLDQYSYNCYGNGIGRQVNTDPTGYVRGDSTRKTFEAVQRDLGGRYYVRELSSIDAPIGEDEFRVAMKCGPDDYHFIRQLSDGTWYNKSGTGTGLLIPVDYILYGPFGDGTWYGYSEEYGLSYPAYTYETIYFAVRIGWDAV